MIGGVIMLKKLQIYKCEICGNIVQIFHAGVGTLVCCKKSMRLQIAHTDGKGDKKHVPVVEDTKHGIIVKIGEIQHPMEEEHYIEWIEVIAGKKIHHKFFEPGDVPELELSINYSEIQASTYCNLHSLWSDTD